MTGQNRKKKCCAGLKLKKKKKKKKKIATAAIARATTIATVAPIARAAVAAVAARTAVAAPRLFSLPENVRHSLPSYTDLEHPPVLWTQESLPHQLRERPQKTLDRQALYLCCSKAMAKYAPYVDLRELQLETCEKFGPQRCE